MVEETMWTVFVAIGFVFLVGLTLWVSQIELPKELKKAGGHSWANTTNLVGAYAFTVYCSAACVFGAILFQPFFEAVDPTVSRPLWLRTVFYVVSLLVAANAIERFWWALKKRHQMLTKKRDDEERLELAKVMAESHHI